MSKKSNKFLDELKKPVSIKYKDGRLDTQAMRDSGKTGHGFYGSSDDGTAIVPTKTRKVVASEPLEVVADVEAPDDDISMPDIEFDEALVEKEDRTPKRNYYMSMPDFKMPDFEMPEIPDEMIVAGVPLVVSALMGRPAVGAGIAGNELIRREKRKEKLMEEEQKRKTEDSKLSRSSAKEAWNPETGQYEWTSVDKVYGKRSPSTEKTYQESERKKMLSDRLMRERYEDLGRINDESILNEGQLKVSKNLKSEFSRSTKANELKKDSIRSALSALRGNTSFGNKIAIANVIKTVETRLSDQDRNYYKNEVSVLARLYSLIMETKDNKVYEKLLNEAKQVINNTADDIEKYDEYMKKNYMEEAISLGLPSSYVYGPMFKSIPLKERAKIKRSKLKKGMVRIKTSDGRTGVFPADKLKKIKGVTYEILEGL